MDVRMPDGTVIKNVPDDFTQEDLMDRYNLYQSKSADTQEDIHAQQREIMGRMSGEIPDLLTDEAVGGTGETLGQFVRPETYRKIGRELTSFPQADPRALLSPEITQATVDIALSALPATRLAKATRFALAGKQDAIGALTKEGVRTTIGQRLGGEFKRAEEALRSVPILGNVIKSAHDRGIEDFTKAAINRTLKPIGQTLPKGVEAGHRAVDYAHKTLSGAYDDVLPKLTGQIDDAFVNTVKQHIDDAAAVLPEAEARRLASIVDRHLFGRATKDGKLTGKALKDSYSAITSFARRFGKAQDPDKQIVGEALDGVKSALSDMLQKSNPKYAQSLKNADFGWANLVRVEKAALSSPTGVFTPAQLANAIKATDTSVRKSAAARGQALLQDLSAAGQEGIAQKLADSGTALRLAPYILAGGAGAAGQQGYISPEVAATIAGLSLLYTPIGQRGIELFGRAAKSPVTGRAALGFAANENLRSIRNP